MGNQQISPLYLNTNNNIEQTEVKPYIEGQTYDQEKSTIEKYLKQTNFKTHNTERNQTINEYRKNNFENVENMQEEIANLEKKHFSVELSDRIREDFELFSKENKMGRNKLLEYFGLQQMNDQELGNRFFQCAKYSYASRKAGPYLDYSKFVKTLSMLSGDNVEGRFRFLYSMFDLDLSGKIERQEMRKVLQMFLESLCSTIFETQELNTLKSIILNAHERQIESALDEIVSNIFQVYQSKNNALEFDEWKQWLLDQNSISEVLQYDPHDNADFDDYDDL